jgi:hypothetical protein
MRLYIFTKRERTIVEQFVSGKIPVTNRVLSQIRTRLKSSSLFSDVELFTSLQKALAKSESATAT